MQLSTIFANKDIYSNITCLVGDNRLINKKIMFLIIFLPSISLPHQNSKHITCISKLKPQAKKSIRLNNKMQGLKIENMKKTLIINLQNALLSNKVT
jgi:hypothetical protein